ncbi:MAG TPA: stage V sporulation protein AD, partial [Firmicutes bacterium]|nr:stage V sporulation protein AD [Bacillota bacterium]
DPNNMGAAMAPAALDTLRAFFRDTAYTPADFDRIITGDLGKLGSRILLELAGREGLDFAGRHSDCGLLLYDLERQDMHCGGSGAGCSAAVFCGYIVSMLQKRRWNRVLFAPTGALLSPTSTLQEESIPGICHVLCISNERE